MGTLFSDAFRPFFLAVAGFAAIAVGLWVTPFLGADIVGEVGQLDLFWHTHEMIFGFVAAAAAEEA